MDQVYSLIPNLIGGSKSSPNHGLYEWYASEL